MKLEAKTERGDPRLPRAQARPRAKVIYKHLIRAVNCCLSTRAILRSVSAGSFGGGYGRSGARRRRRRRRSTDNNSGKLSTRQKELTHGEAYPYNGKPKK